MISGSQFLQKARMLEIMIEEEEWSKKWLSMTKAVRLINGNYFGLKKHTTDWLITWHSITEHFIEISLAFYKI